MQTERTSSRRTPIFNVPVVGDFDFQRCLEAIQWIASNTADLKSRFSEGIESIGICFAAPYAMIRANVDDLRIEHEHCCGDVPAETWQQLCSVPMLECLSTQEKQASFYVERTTGTRTAVIAVPTSRSAGGPIGVACVVVPAEDAIAAKRVLEQFQSLILELTAQNLTRLTASEELQVSEAKGPKDSNFSTTFCSGRIWDNPTELAFHFVNGLCNQLHCVDVSFGMVQKKQVQLLAISGSESVYRRSPGCLAIEQAMAEAVDAEHTIVLQQDDPSGDPTEHLNCALHQALRIESGNNSCLSMPLSHNGQVVAVCTLRRDGNRPFTQDEIATIESCRERIAAYVVVATRLNQSFVSRFCEQLSKTAKHKAFLGTGRRLLVLAAAAIFITYLVLPWPHSLSIPCTLVSSQQRVYSAPFAGKLKRSYFRSGEWVSQGSVLFELDTEELVIQKAKLESEWKSRNQAMIRFLQASDTAKAGEEKSNIAAISNELAMINSKLENAIVLAQESGTVIQSELHQREGEMLSLGEPLLNFAPSRTHQVELRIPDHLGMEFRAGQQGRFATSAEPDQWRDIIVERVEMASTAMNGENFIKAIATTSQGDEATRFGLSGFARISVGNQPGWWILLQHPIRYVQRKVSQL